LNHPNLGWDYENTMLIIVQYFSQIQVLKKIIENKSGEIE
jgi:hypothetical protein